MKASEFKALSLNAQSSNTINQALSLDLLGLKYQAVPAYRGLKEVETAILQNIGQLANSSLSGWSGSIVPSMGDVVLPLWQLAPRGKDGGYPRSVALPDMSMLLFRRLLCISVCLSCIYTTQLTILQPLDRATSFLLVAIVRTSRRGAVLTRRE